MPLFNSKKTVIPVLEIERREDAIPLAQALLDGGLDVLEITLRSDAALDAAKDIIENFPKAKVGIGAILSKEQLQLANAIGSQFNISPGLTAQLAADAKELSLTLLPGVSTVSEVMNARELGFSKLKLFPASLAGGTSLLKSFNSLFPNSQFCPTGGISLDNLEQYLALDNVFAVGGSWIAPKDLIAVKNWQEISARAAQARNIVERFL